MLRELGGRKPAEFALRSLLVELTPPHADHRAGIRAAREPVFISALIAQSAVEALDECPAEPDIGLHATYRVAGEGSTL